MHVIEWLHELTWALPHRGQQNFMTVHGKMFKFRHFSKRIYSCCPLIMTVMLLSLFWIHQGHCFIQAAWGNNCTLNDPDEFSVLDVTYYCSKVFSSKMLNLTQHNVINFCGYSQHPILQTSTCVFIWNQPLIPLFPAHKKTIYSKCHPPHNLIHCISLTLSILHHIGLLCCF